MGIRKGSRRGSLMSENEVEVTVKLLEISLGRTSSGEIATARPEALASSTGIDDGRPILVVRMNDAYFHFSVS
jgi:hypothetical protein